jgi:phosphoglycolate phosphatase-like HAD superfamily hydrolase
MQVVVFSWSGSFRKQFDKRENRLRAFIDEMHDRGLEIGLVTDTEVDQVDDLLPTDFVIPHVAELDAVLTALTTKYDKVFFISDVKAELATANQSGAFTIGLASTDTAANDLSGVGPNYVVDSLDELEEILQLEVGQ